MSRKRKKAEAVTRLLKETYPDVKCALEYESAFQLLISTALSAQATDVSVNKVTPALFSVYSTPELLASARLEAIEGILKSLNLYKTKARNIIALSKHLNERFNGEVPSSLAELITLPGVGRKTANVVMGVWFGISEGLVVDTHVLRVSQRLGLSDKKDAERMEKELLPIVPSDERTLFTLRVIEHGRQVCTARRPLCHVCPLQDICESAFNFPHYASKRE